MVIILSSPNRLPKRMEVSFSLGDVVKITNPNSCMENHTITTMFGIENPRTIKEHTNPFLRGYPNLYGNNDEWRVEKIMGKYCTSILILLKNRRGQYTALSHSMVGAEPIRVIRKYKGNRIERMSIKNCR